MAAALPISTSLLQRLKRLLSQNPHINMKVVDLQRPDWARQFNWQGISRDKEDFLPGLRSYQRLLRLTPNDDPETVFALLQRNFHSAIDIAAVPRRQFMRRFAPLFSGGRETVEAIYRNAVAVRARVLCKYLAFRQSQFENIRKTKPNQEEGTL